MRSFPLRYHYYLELGHAIDVLMRNECVFIHFEPVLTYVMGFGALKPVCNARVDVLGRLGLLPAERFVRLVDQFNDPCTACAPVPCAACCHQKANVLGLLWRLVHVCDRCWLDDVRDRLEHSVRSFGRGQQLGLSKVGSTRQVLVSLSWQRVLRAG